MRFGVLMEFVWKTCRRFPVFLFPGAILALFWGCSDSAGPEVVVYTSVDQVYSEPILKTFEKKYGIRVRAVYDVEASKTTGLINRLIAERNAPHCDVFWNSEFAGTVLLKNKGVLAPYFSPAARDIPARFRDSDGYWTGCSARAHVIIYNTSLVKKDDVPESIFDLAAPEWRGRFAMAYPLFGTTATFMAVLHVVLGMEQARDFIVSLRDNGVVIVNGNAVSRDYVVDGKVPVALTDTDDVNVARLSGRPVDMVYPDQHGIGTFLIPSTVALVRGGPNEAYGKKLMDYLLSRDVEERLAFCEAGQMPLRHHVKKPDYVPDYTSLKTIDVDYSRVAQVMQESARFCQGLFSKPPYDRE